jgi:methanogenic corrinoid protein MtbC1
LGFWRVCVFERPLFDLESVSETSGVAAVIYKSEAQTPGSGSGATGAHCRGDDMRPGMGRLLSLPADLDTQRLGLAQLIEAKIAPRLLMIHLEHESIPSDVIGQEQICEFSILAIAPDDAGATAYFEALRARGLSLDALCIHLLAPAARCLGEMWVEDRCDFFDVTLGLGRLQNLMAAFEDSYEARSGDSRHCALLMAPLGESHHFGINMVGQFLNNAGWRVAVETDVSVNQPAALLAREWIGVVGFTLSAECRLETLAKMITIARRESLNTLIGVMVGGPLFLDRPELAVQVGADGCATDAPAAVILAKRLLMRQAGQSTMG